jgi:hypothetical protein
VATTDLPARWRAQAEQLERFAPAAATAFRDAAAELESALHAADAEELTLREAAKESGYAERTLREKLAKKEIPNAGERHRPRIRRADLPRRARAAGGAWDPSEHVQAITARPS